MYRLMNALGFQAGWWACVASVGLELQAQALAFCAGLVVAHLWHCARPWKEIQMAGVSLAMGIVADSLLQYFSVIQFSGIALAPLSPLWLWMLWVMFAMTLNTSMAFLATRPWWLSAGLGAVCGPMSYVAGARLGAAIFDASPFHMAVLATMWSLAMPALVFINLRIYSQESTMSLEQ